MDFDAARKVLAALERENVHYAVFGGAALNLHGLARLTQDLDIFIEPTGENVERLKCALRSVYADPSIEEILASDLLGDYPAVQYVPPAGAFHLDILTRLGEAFAFADLETQTIAFDGLDVHVVTPRMLYRMKRDTMRAKDRADAEALRQRFGLEDEP